MERPNFISEQHLEVLQKLDDAALSNMFCAVPYLLDRCPDLTAKQAQETLLFWFNTSGVVAEQELLVAQ